MDTSQYHVDDFAEEYDTIHDALTKVNTVTGFDGDMVIYFLPSNKYLEIINALQIYGGFNVSVENVVEGYYGYGFGYDEEKWFSTIIKTIHPTAISKEDYIEIREESD